MREEREEKRIRRNLETMVPFLWGAVVAYFLTVVGGQNGGILALAVLVLAFLALAIFDKWPFGGP